MGNLLSICPCNSEDNSKYVKNEYDPIGGLNLGKPQYQEQISRGSADQLLDTHSSLPSNIIDIKIGKKDLIKKRFESPYEHYEVIKKLGKGSFGVVYMVKNKASQIPRALKELSKALISNGVNSEEIANEINILRMLDHPNIIRIFEFFEDADNFYVVTELCDKGDLSQKIGDGTVPEFIVKYLMKQVFETIA